MFGPKRDENGEWRRLQNEELHSLYRSLNTVRVIISRRLRWAGHVARMKESRTVFKTLTDKPIGKRLLGRPRRRWEKNIRMSLKEMGINTKLESPCKCNFEPPGSISHRVGYLFTTSPP